MYPPSSPIALRTALIAMALAAACQQTPVETRAPVETRPPAVAPRSALPSPPVDGARFRIDPAASDLRVIVYRGGPLAQFGHNHVLVAGDLRGDVQLAPVPARSTFSLEFSPAAFIIDPVEARLEEGPDFEAQPSAEAIEGTRANLLGPRVLDAERFPEITMRSAGIQGTLPHPIVTVRIGLHGVERDVSFPIDLEHDGDRLVAKGTLLLSTPDFGIPSFTVMGGGLKVQEEVKIKFLLVAARDQ
jgi:hypothetical protein